MSNKFKSDLSIAKGSGCSGTGSSHWWHQRFTAIILGILAFWIIFFAYQLSGRDFFDIIVVARLPHNVIILTLLTIFTFYHSSLGMQVIIEDYVSCKSLRFAMILFVQIFSIVTVISFIVAAIYVMNL